MIKIMKIIAGGQTGADRAVLDVAISLGIPHGGKCPKGRRAEDGKIPDNYNLEETTSSSYEERTALNVIESDATLIFFSKRMSPGSALTWQLARDYAKPFLKVDVEHPESARLIADWLLEVAPSVLNGAGTRESKCPGMSQKVFNILTLALSLVI